MKNMPWNSSSMLVLRSFCNPEERKVHSCLRDAISLHCLKPTTQLHNCTLAPGQRINWYFNYWKQKHQQTSSCLLLYPTSQTSSLPSTHSIFLHHNHPPTPTNTHRYTFSPHQGASNIPSPSRALHLSVPNHPLCVHHKKSQQSWRTLLDSFTRLMSPHQTQYHANTRWRGIQRVVF